MTFTEDQIDLMLATRAPKQSWAHQYFGVHKMVKLVEPEIGRVWPGCIAEFDEMGAGKSKQIADAAQVLFEMGEIDTVLVTGPSTVRHTWFDKELGQIATHRWPDLKVHVLEVHSRERRWSRGSGGKTLNWIVCNLEYFRSSPDNLNYLVNFCGPKTFLVVDESAAIKSPTSQQSKAVERLRFKFKEQPKRGLVQTPGCGRVAILNGTPISNDVGDLFQQAYTLDPRILGYKNYHVFKSIHAVMGGWQNKQVLSWRGVEDIQKRMAPYVLRRMKADCMDLPEKLPPVTISAPLSPKTWKIYREMRDNAVAWLSENVSASPKQAGVKAMRLAQITSGFLGGLQEKDLCEPCEGSGCQEDGEACVQCGGLGSKYQDRPPQQIGSEKFDVVKSWLSEQLDADPAFKVLMFHRFRFELPIMEKIASDMGFLTGLMWGGLKRGERERVLRLGHPDSTPKDKPVIIDAIWQSGSVSINFAGISHVLGGSHGTSLKDKLQADDRVHRGGQTRNVWYGDVVATGPDGQKTIDHHITKALRNKDDAAKWTTSAWIQALTEE